jgi:hypothetical protein
MKISASALGAGPLLTSTALAKIVASALPPLGMLTLASASAFSTY